MANFKTLYLTLFFLLTGHGVYLVGAFPIGLCYKMSGNNLPRSTQIVSMYESHNISLMRLYEPNHSLFEALRGSRIQVLIGVRSEDIKHLASSSDSSKFWIAENIEPYWPAVRFRYIAVGNEAIPGPYAEHVLPAMKNLVNALHNLFIWDIKVSTAISTSVMAISYPPSAGVFAYATRELMVPIADYLTLMDAPLLANIYPYYTLRNDLTYSTLGLALFHHKNPVLKDYTFKYKNLFEEMIDALYVSLAKIGAPNINIVVSETGWPSRGQAPFCTARVARVYNQNVVKHASSMEGTPRRRGTIETYLFAMFDANKTEGSHMESHWGLFSPNNGKLVYPICFSVGI